MVKWMANVSRINKLLVSMNQNSCYKIVLDYKFELMKDMEQEQKVQFCVFCNEVAELMCGKCQEVYYCRVEHQKMDWRRHSATCKSVAERREIHLDNKKMRKTQIFQRLSRTEYQKSIDVAKKLIDAEKKFIEKYAQADIELEIELGSTVCVLVRLLIAAKEFSNAQDFLSDYFKERNNFLSNTDNISSKEELDQMDSESKQRQIYLISGKLKLISSLANLMHELIRNSVDMFGILIAHIQKVYGSDSLELSNVYFSTANYLNFLNQSNKALACFLKAGKLRKEKGGTAYYNVGLLLLKAGRKKKALEYFQLALELVEKEKNPQNSYVIPQIYENIALIYMQEGMSKLMIDYFERAYYYYTRTKNKPKADQIMKLFMLIRKQAKEQGSDQIKSIEFVKEKKDKRPLENISMKNKQKYKNADRVTQDDDRKKTEWVSSFRELKLAFKEPSVYKIPKEAEYIFGNELHRHGDDQDQRKMPASDSNRLGFQEGINMDINYMRTLSSNEVGYLHELNRQLMECKESAAYYDIVENSNFYQAVNRDKLNDFYRLNHRLVRPTDLDRRLMLRATKEQDFEGEDEDQYYDAVEMPMNPQPPRTPKLDLSKIKSQL